MMRTLFTAALLFASVAVASPDAPLLLAQAEGAPAAAPVAAEEEDDEDDEEDEEEEATPTGPEGTGTGTDVGAGTPDPATGAPGATGATAAPAAPATLPNPRAQELVSGAPLYNPNVAVHIVEKKQFSDKGKHELVLYPAVAQINSKFTEHYGTALTYVYHLHENFGLTVSPQYHWYNSESGFNQELINKVREEAQAASSLLLNWGVIGGVEVTPLYGKFAWYQDSLAHYSLVVTGGAGYGSTRHQLKPANEAGPATFGDTGNRFIGSVGGGFRVLLGNRFAIRLEVRDIVYTAAVQNVNGCNFGDLDAMDKALRAGRPVTSAVVTEACQVGTFDGTNDAGQNRSTDVPLALSLVRDPTSDVLNLVSFYGGVSFIF